METTQRRKTARRTILIVHGNAGSAIDRLGYADGIRSLEPVDVYILEYPGYGPREGSPSEQSLFRAASEALKLLGTNAPVCVLGESLGTGVACYLAGAYPTKVKGIVLIAPYNNLTEVARHHMPLFPVKWLLRDRFPSARHLNGFRGPVAVLLAGRDLVVPEPLGRKLYESYRGPKRLWEFPEAGHEDLLEQPQSWWRELLAFWDSSG